MISDYLDTGGGSVVGAGLFPIIVHGGTGVPAHDPVRTGRPARQDRQGGEVYVYRRAGAPCLVCDTAVARTAHAGRNLYWCPRCQQRPVP